MKNIHTLLLGLGATCLALLVWEIGPGTLWHDTEKLGWGAGVIIAVAALEQLFHTLAWQRCFEPAERPSLRRLYGAHLAGGAINIVTPTATLGGELVRGGLLPGVPGTVAAATVTVDRLAYALADTSLGILGSLSCSGRRRSGLGRTWQSPRPPCSSSLASGSSGHCNEMAGCCPGS